MPQPELTGGCQCGAVRFTAKRLGRASICHCRMCQKASGNFYLPLVTVRGAKVDWTRGEPKRFRSSNAAWRGFCPECGTPLTYRSLPGNFITVTLGSLDDPNAVTPLKQYGVESRVSWLPGALARPEVALSDWFKRKGITSVGSHQHPDRDG